MSKNNTQKGVTYQTLNCMCLPNVVFVPAM